jgi:hypothetical protein
MFFGTPHAGATGAEFQTIMTNIGRIFVPANSGILSLLRRDSDHLRSLTGQYSPISSHFKNVFFFEEYKTPLFGGASIMVECFHFTVFLACLNKFVDCSQGFSSGSWSCQH